MLKDLAEKDEKKSWEEIAQKLNQNFNKNVRTGRQCRSKYVNYSRFNGINSESNDWSPEEEKLLLKLYIESGSSWSSYVEMFDLKSENSIKNKFYNNLRKACRKIEDHEIVFFKNTRAHLKYESIVSILELCSLIKKWSLQNGSIFNKECDLFSSRDKILKLAFSFDENFEDKEMTKLIQSIKGINKKLRGFGIFKTKSKKGWKLSEKRIQSLLNFDNIIEMSSNTNGKKLESSLNLEQPQQFQQASLSQKTIENELQSLNLDDFEKQFSNNKECRKRINLEGNFVQESQISTMFKKDFQFQEILLFFN